MAQRALYSKWRPMTFNDVVGQEHIIQTLQNAIISDRVGHAYLFSGPRGTGKTSMARLLAKGMNCLENNPASRPCNACDHCLAVNEGSYLDLIEIDAASHTSVDDVRELREKIAFSPSLGRYKVYIIDEVHRFSGSAFDALLKTLEEPPAHAIFILATTEIHKVPQTIQSRCQRFDFRRIPMDLIAQRLGEIADYEGVSSDWGALELIARQGTGAMRDSISLLDQLLPENGQHLSLEAVQAVLGTTTDAFTQALTDSLVTTDSVTGLRLINEAIRDGLDARQIAGQLVEYLRAIMVTQTGGGDLLAMEISVEALSLIEQQAGKFPRKALFTALNLFNDSFNDRYQSSNWYPQLPLEIAFLESINAIYEEYGHEATQPAKPAGKPVTREASAPSREASTPSTPAPAESDRIESGSLDNPSPVQAEISLPFQEVASKWKHVGNLAKQFGNSGEAQGMANTAVVTNVEDSTIYVQVKSRLLQEKFNKDENFKAIMMAAEKVYNTPVKIICSVGNSQTQEEGGDEMLEDSVLAYAVNELGGKIKRIDKDES